VHTGDATLLCLPLIVSGRSEGVLAVRLEGGGLLDPAQRELLDTFASQLAVATEIQRLAQEDRRIRLLADSERLQKTLFDSVSHELKTPIAAIRVALEQPEINVDEIRRANERLQQSVECLLSATRIESGLIKLTRIWCDVAEVAHEASVLSQTVGKIAVHVVESQLLVWLDFGLTIQSLAMLLENAITHGAKEPAPELLVYREEGFVCFRVSDSGLGLPAGDEERVFERFYRRPGTQQGGLGLGLSIARSLAEVQGGSLTAVRGTSSGAVFLLRLPLGGNPELPE
jgi:two-component system sensor histidine kinase KdpD